MGADRGHGSRGYAVSGVTAPEGHTVSGEHSFLQCVHKVAEGHGSRGHRVAGGVAPEGTGKQGVWLQRAQESSGYAFRGHRAAG